MVEWPDESQRLNKSHRVARLEFAYSHIKDSWTRGNKMLRSDETKIQLFGVFGGNQTQIICRPVPSLQWNMVLPATWYGLVLQQHLKADWSGQTN